MVFACTSCGWVRRSVVPVDEARCPLCHRPARALTSTGSLRPGRAPLAAATARALHDPALTAGMWRRRREPDL
jgi:hypothetical protein